MSTHGANATVTIWISLASGSHLEQELQVSETILVKSLRTWFVSENQSLPV